MVGKGTSYNGNDNTSKCMEWDDERQVYYNTAVFTELKSAGSSCRNPGGSGERPWCYTDFASPTSSTRWKYCDIPKCRKFHFVVIPYVNTCNSVVCTISFEACSVHEWEIQA